MIIQDVVYTAYCNLRNYFDEPVHKCTYGPVPKWTPLT